MTVRGGIAVEIDAARVARSLTEAEALLIDLASIETTTRAQGGIDAARLPQPLAARVALSALYRVSDMLLEQLPPVPRGAVRARGYGIAWLPQADLRILRAAADALTHPTGELAALLPCCRHNEPTVLTRLLSHLRPLPSDSGPDALERDSEQSSTG